MSQTDVFALQNSKLNEFLFAEIGVELNGSTLTTLSALARLGKDPWAEAARWAREPKADAIEWLTANIVEMPLCSQDIHDARSTAARLVSLLPMQSRSSVIDATSRTVPKWGWMVLAYFWICLALNASMALSHKPDPAVPTPVVQPTGQPH